MPINYKFDYNCLERNFTREEWKAAVFFSWGKIPPLEIAKINVYSNLQISSSYERINYMFFWRSNTSNSLFNFEWKYLHGNSEEKIHSILLKNYSNSSDPIPSLFLEWNFARKFILWIYSVNFLESNLTQNECKVAMFSVEAIVKILPLEVSRENVSLKLRFWLFLEFWLQMSAYFTQLE